MNAPEGLPITDHSLTLLAMRGQEIRQIHVTHTFVSKTYGKKSYETVISSVWNNILGYVLGRSGNAAFISRKLFWADNKLVTVLATHTNAQILTTH